MPDRPVRHPRTAHRTVAERGLVVVIDQHKLHTLNPVGTRVWELCDGREVDAIIDAIVDEFDVERDVASRDVRGFLDRLQALGALQWESA